MTRHVIEKDHGWDGMVKEIMQLDGLELRVGLMDPKATYKRGEAPVGKVMKIHKLFRALSAVVDARRGETNKGISKVLALLKKRVQVDAAKLIHEIIGVPLRDAVIEAMYQQVNERTSTLRKAIKSTVFDIGNRRRGNKDASKGKVVAGQRPRGPRKGR